MNLVNRAIALTLPYVPKSIVRKVSERYIAGETLEDAVRVVRELNSHSAMATVDVLGEYITRLDQAEANTTYSIQVIERLAKESLQGNLSIKLTSLGLGMDDAICEANVRRILDAGKRSNIFVRFDMENSEYTTRTIGLYRRLRHEYTNIGVVLQAYLKRTEHDIREIIAEGKAAGLRTNFRLCKGIYIEPAEIAYKDREEVQRNYLRCLSLIVEGGAYVGIATHDDVLIDGAKRIVKEHQLPREAYEFQMLLGVRENVRDQIIREGYRLRVYVPFGDDWYGYSVRRLKENPSIAGYVLKALLTGK